MNLGDILSKNNKVEESKKLIKEIYAMDNKPWVIGYSGGKDSTVVCQLIFSALIELKKEKLNKRVYIISSDTMIENPLIVDNVHTSMRMMKEKAEELELPFDVHLIKPKVDQTFWVNVIGRGYPTPNQTFRWCTDRLKIDPANRFIENVVDSHGEVIMVLGVREGESNSRDRVLESHSIEGKKLMRHTTMKNAYVFAPIKNFDVNDVWDSLLSNESPWGGDNKKLYEMYADSNANECPLVTDSNIKDKAGSCGNSRFGCWACTVVSQDKSLTGFIENGEEWLRPLLQYRNNLAKIRDRRDKRMKIRTSGSIYFSPVKEKSEGVFEIAAKGDRKKQIITRNQEDGNLYDLNNDIWKYYEHESGAKRQLNKFKKELTGSYDPKVIVKLRTGGFGQVGLGPFTMDTRTTLLKELLELQILINQTRTIELITNDELLEISKLWKDQGIWKDLVEEIYFDVYEEKLNWIEDDLFLIGESEEEALREACEKNGGDIKLLKDLFSIGRKHTGARQRIKAQKEIEKKLKQDYLNIEE